MAKRTAEAELNHDNWDQEEEEEEAGKFRLATKDVMEKREIKKGKRRLGSEDGNGGANSGACVFKGFSFGIKGQTSGPSDSSSKPFSSVSQPSVTSGNSAKPAFAGFGFTAASSATTTATTATSAATAATTATCVKSNSPESASASDIKANETTYRRNLRTLNESVLRWIDDHVKRNPYCILTPVFADYEKYIGELDRDFPSKPEESSAETSSRRSESPADASSVVGEKPAGFSFAEASATSPSTRTCSAVATTTATSIGTASATSTVFGAGFFGKQGNAEGKVFGSPSKGPSSFSFSTTVSSATSTGLSFGAQDNKAASGFSFGIQSSKDETATTASRFSFGSQPSKDASATTTSGFSFAALTSKDATATTTSGFSFAALPSKDATASTNSGFSFAALPSKDATALTTSGFSFASQSSSQESGSASTEATAQSSTQKEAGDDENYVPPKAEVVEIAEEGAFYTVRCKLYFKIQQEFQERGLGNLYLKPCGEKTQLLIRAGTTLGNILLNVMLSKNIPASRQGNKVSIMCIPNPPLSSEADKNQPICMLIRVKTEEEAEALLKQINDHKV